MKANNKILKKQDEIKASYKDGVLEISVPKAEVKKAKKVEISQ